MKFISVILYEIVCLYLSLCFYKSAISSYQFDWRAHSCVVPDEVNTKKKKRNSGNTKIQEEKTLLELLLKHFLLTILLLNTQISKRFRRTSDLVIRSFREEHFFYFLT